MAGEGQAHQRAHSLPILEALSNPCLKCSSDSPNDMNCYVTADLQLTSATNMWTQE